MHLSISITLHNTSFAYRWQDSLATYIRYHFWYNRKTYVTTFGVSYASACLDLSFWDSAYLISLSWSTLSMHLCISIYTLYVYIHFSYSSLRYSSLREYPPNEHYTFVTLSHLRPILYLPSLFCIYFHFYTLILLLVWISLSNILPILSGTFLCHC